MPRLFKVMTRCWQFDFHRHCLANYAQSHVVYQRMQTINDIVDKSGSSHHESGSQTDITCYPQHYSNKLLGEVSSALSDWTFAPKLLSTDHKKVTEKFYEYKRIRVRERVLLLFNFAFFKHSSEYIGAPKCKVVAERVGFEDILKQSDASYSSKLMNRRSFEELQLETPPQRKNNNLNIKLADCCPTVHKFKQNLQRLNDNLKTHRKEDKFTFKPMCVQEMNKCLNGNRQKETHFSQKQAPFHFKFCPTLLPQLLKEFSGDLIPNEQKNNKLSKENLAANYQRQKCIPKVDLKSFGKVKQKGIKLQLNSDRQAIFPQMVPKVIHMFSNRNSKGNNDKSNSGCSNVHNFNRKNGCLPTPSAALLPKSVLKYKDLRIGEKTARTRRLSKFNFNLESTRRIDKMAEPASTPSKYSDLFSRIQCLESKCEKLKRIRCKNAVKG